MRFSGEDNYIGIYIWQVPNKILFCYLFRLCKGYKSTILTMNHEKIVESAGSVNIVPLHILFYLLVHCIFFLQYGCSFCFCRFAGLWPVNVCCFQACFKKIMIRGVELDEKKVLCQF